MTAQEFESAVAHNMAILGISRQDAEELVRFDNGETDNDVVTELTAKASQIHNYVSSGVRTPTKREHKVDEDKAHLLEKLMLGLQGVTTIDSINHESNFDFNFNGYNYTVKLIQHRPHK